MKAIMITAPSSNTGKTTITLGILRALKNRNMDLAPFKTGPDYIDTKFLEIAGGNTCGNLDLHMMGEEGLKQAAYLNKKKYGLIEGAMGYFDGIYNTYENSSYDISKYLEIPSVLIYEPKGEMFSAITKIKGMVDFSQSRIKGIIFNKCSRKIYEMLKDAVEEYTDLIVLGYLPEIKELKIDSRHLGLILPEEVKNLDKNLDFLSRQIEDMIDLDTLIQLMEECKLSALRLGEKLDISLAIAKDPAFNFYYSENIRILEKMTHLKYFSPLEDSELPEADILYIGGGYPELYLKELEKNKDMREAIKEFGELGKYIYAEGGGLMYLSNSIDNYEMCGLIDGDVSMTNKTQKFGYTNMEFLEDSILAKKGEVLHGKEFHKSRIETKKQKNILVTKPMNPQKWKCGYIYKNILGIYGHINFLGNQNIVIRMLKEISKENA